MSQSSALPYKILAIDASLNSLGVAYRAGNQDIQALCVNIGKNHKGMERVFHVREAVAFHLRMQKPTLVAYEGYALGYRGKSNIIFDIGELGGCLKLLILSMGIDILLIPPTSMKQFVTGKGNADKDEVAAALADEVPRPFATFDQYDATGLLLMGEAFCNRRLLPRERKGVKHKAISACTVVKSDAFAIDCT